MATHWSRRLLDGHDRQKVVHRSGLAAQAVLIPIEPSATPAKASPMLRNDSRRETDVANDLDSSSRHFMIETLLRIC
jgi:hypothetical protein